MNPKRLFQVFFLLPLSLAPILAWGLYQMGFSLHAIALVLVSFLASSFLQGIADGEVREYLRKTVFPFISLQGHLLPESRPALRPQATSAIPRVSAAQRQHVYAKSTPIILIRPLANIHSGNWLEFDKSRSRTRKGARDLSRGTASEPVLAQKTRIGIDVPRAIKSRISNAEKESSEAGAIDNALLDVNKLVSV